MVVVETKLMTRTRRILHFEWEDKNGEKYLWKFWKLYVGSMYMCRRDIFEPLILGIITIIVVLTRDDRSKNKFLTFNSTALQRADSRPLGL